MFRGYAISRIRNFYLRKIKYTQQNYHDKLTQILTDFPRMEVRLSKRKEELLGKDVCYPELLGRYNFLINLRNFDFDLIKFVPKICNKKGHVLTNLTAFLCHWFLIKLFLRPT